VKLSNAQSLRVIGQELAEFGVDVFNLARRDDEYTVWIDNRKFQPVVKEKTLTERIMEKILGGDESALPEVPPDSMRFPSLQILWKDVARQLNRHASHGVADLNELSLLLRALGDFLDRNQAEDFAVFWSTHAVKVVFDSREENFNLVNLYNMGTRMYLKRSNRLRPK
jgi:hypothetical protein